MTLPRLHRILLKLSGEALMGEGQYGIDPDTVAGMAAEIKGAKEQGLQVCLVIGGGNIFRGMAGAAKGMDRAQADYMGMLATVMNALAMQNALEQMGVETRVQSAIKMDQVCEPIIRRRAERHLAKGRVVIFAAGVGSPYFTTDTGAALRAAELKADVILMAKNGVDGIYTADPHLDPTAVKINNISYLEAINRGLQVMDSTALTFCMDNNLPIVVFNMFEPGTAARIIAGERLGTLVSQAAA